MQRGSAGAPILVYTSVMRTLHWSTVVLVLCGFAAGWTMEDAPSQAERAGLIMLHRSLGVTILLLTAIRLAVRVRSPIPPLPSDMPLLQRIAARLNIAGLYGALLLQPILGLIASMLGGGTVVLFDVALPRMLPTNVALADVLFRLHGGGALLFLISIGLHAAAALYHYFVRNDLVLASMLATRFVPPREKRRAS
jgi:cytochrome b561